MSEQNVPETTGIVVRGARTHNLKNVGLTLPAGRLAIITGVSGSGKSSLAFDTIYAEGQRRYVESLSAYARQFLERMEKPDVDSHRRRVAGDRHPPEEQHPQPAVDGRHDDRDPRLPAAAVRAGRPDVLPAVRPGRDARDRGGGGRPAGRAARRARACCSGFDVPVVPGGDGHGGQTAEAEEEIAESRQRRGAPELRRRGTASGPDGTATRTATARRTATAGCGRRRHARGAAQEGVRPPARRRPRRAVRRGRRGGAGGPARAAGDRRSHRQSGRAIGAA